MFKHIALTLGIASLAIPAQGKEIAKVGIWTIKTADNPSEVFCYATTNYFDGTQVDVSYDARKELWLYIFTNLKWKSLRNFGDFPVQLILERNDGDNVNPLVTTAHPTSADVWPGFSIGVHTNDQSKFMPGWMASHRVRVIANHRQVVNLQLTDSYEASMAIARCSGSLRDRASSDPFKRQ